MEKDKSQDTSNGIDTTSDDDFEVICRCSSTPLSTNNDSRSSTSSQKAAVASTDEASPIKKETGCKENRELESLDPAADTTYVQSQYHGRATEADEMASESLSDGDVTRAQMQISGLYDTSLLVSMSQPVPVYNVNGDTVTYVSGPVTTASSYTAYTEEGGCHVQIPNGFTVAYPSKTDDTQSGESVTSCGQNPADAGASGQQPDAYNFVYPSIYVSNAGLISVLLRHDMSVEMTVDRTIRVVSHQHMMAVATDSRGTSACLYHPALKVIQQGTTTDIATDAVRVHMGHDDVAFAIGHNRYRFDAYDIQPATHVKFSDIFKDQSVNLLFSSEGYGESLVPHCLEVASKAEYANLPKGGVIVRINGVKVTQTGGGDVTVVTGAKFIRLSPSFGMTRLGNRFIDIEIERDWSCRVSRGPHCFFAGDRRIIITNGKLEVDVNEQGRFKVAHLNPHRPVTPQHCLRQPDTYVRRVNSVTYTASSAARAALAARTPPTRRRSAPVTR
ncbi:uncharacterized protein LOC143294137 [Babylonia areolata]|uniref:uncharacterized protein LOC143294137 n=1 Tax=Babylonia areolata TaxID=304850 RepID=UPI003FD4DDEF